MLQGTFGSYRRLARALVVTASVCLFAAAADAPPAPLTPLGVCDVLRDLPHMEGKELAVVGRYSFRAEGRWMSEQSCDAAPSGAAATPPELWLEEDTRDAPKPPGQFEIDNIALHKKLTEISRHTSLGKFRFGTPDYDRWAVVYGRVLARKGEEAKKAPANLLFRGSGVVIFLTMD